MNKIKFFVLMMLMCLLLLIADKAFSQKSPNNGEMVTDFSIIEKLNQVTPTNPKTFSSFFRVKQSDKMYYFVKITKSKFLLADDMVGTVTFKCIPNYGTESQEFQILAKVKTLDKIKTFTTIRYNIEVVYN